MEKFAVMTPAQVAATRQAMKEMEEMYFHAKVEALGATVEEMAQTNMEYTLRDLRAMSGLSSMELVAQLDPHRYCKASQEAGIHRKRIRRSYRETTHNFVEVMADGSVNPNSTLAIICTEAVFQVLPEKIGRN
jgi:hypothetical protein